MASVGPAGVGCDRFRRDLRGLRGVGGRRYSAAVLRASAGLSARHGTICGELCGLCQRRVCRPFPGVSGRALGLPSSGPPPVMPSGCGSSPAEDRAVRRVGSPSGMVFSNTRGRRCLGRCDPGQAAGTACGGGHLLRRSAGGRSRAGGRRPGWRVGGSTRGG